MEVREREIGQGVSIGCRSSRGSNLEKKDHFRRRRAVWVGLGRGKKMGEISKKKQGLEGFCQSMSRGEVYFDAGAQPGTRGIPSCAVSEMVIGLNIRRGKTAEERRN